MHTKIQYFFKSISQKILELAKALIKIQSLNRQPRMPTPRSLKGISNHFWSRFVLQPC